MPTFIESSNPLRPRDFPNSRAGISSVPLDFFPRRRYGGGSPAGHRERSPRSMENKKTFGEYICRRRKELGLTQKEFAQRLFVTESAVSKWERGLSYPDVTLLRDICAILEISEHELLTASEDTEGRRVEQLAKKYLALTRNFRLGQYIFYGIVLLVCLIVNLSVDHRLDWFFIALTVTGAFASLTLVPALVEQYRGAWAAGSFTLWTELALLTSCLYTGGDWFPVAAMGTLFGLSIFLVPIALRSLPLPGEWQNRKSLLYFTAELVLLLLLLAVCAWDARAAWFPVAAISVIFGVTLVLLPFLMRQIPLPENLRQHKALVYFSFETVLLLVLELICSFDSQNFWFFLPGLPMTLYLVFLPWAVMLLIRYAPIGGWFKASGCCALVALYHAATPAVVERILVLSGEEMGRPLAGIPWFTLHLGDWSTSWAIGNNINALFCLAMLALAAIYLVIGVLRRK